MKVDDLQIIDVGKERSAQRNIGLKQCKADYILILDSDQSISRNLIEECLYLFSIGYSAIYIPEIIVATSWFGKIRKFEREFYTGTAIDVPRFVKKNCPKFDESLNGPEDSAWGHELNGIRAISKNVLYHHDDVGVFEYFRKKAYYTKSMNLYAKKYPKDRCLDWRYRCFTVFTERGKWKKLIRHPLLTLGVMAIVFVRGIIYLTRR